MVLIFDVVAVMTKTGHRNNAIAVARPLHALILSVPTASALYAEVRLDFIWLALFS